jgi:hypothetical protein
VTLHGTTVTVKIQFSVFAAIRFVVIHVMKHRTVQDTLRSTFRLILHYLAAILSQNDGQTAGQVCSLSYHNL